MAEWRKSLLMAGGLCLRRISYPTPRNVTDRLREPKAHATTAKTTSKPVWRRTHFCHPPTAHRSTFIEIKALLVFSLWRQIASKGCGGEIGRKTVIIFRVSRSQFLLRRLVLWMSKRLSDCVSLFEGPFRLHAVLEIESALHAVVLSSFCFLFFAVLLRS